jgi:hypothetical protein
MENIKVPFKQVAHLIRAAYGQSINARRPVRIEPKEQYSVNDYWDGGSRNYSVFMNLQTMEIIRATDLPQEMRQKEGNHYKLAIATVTLQPQIIVVEHIIFCGKDLGYRICVHPTIFAMFKGEGSKLPTLVPPAKELGE